MTNKLLCACGKCHECKKNENFRYPFDEFWYNKGFEDCREIINKIKKELKEALREDLNMEEVMDSVFKEYENQGDKLTK